MPRLDPTQVGVQGHWHWWSRAEKYATANPRGPRGNRVVRSAGARQVARRTETRPGARPLVAQRFRSPAAGRSRYALPLPTPSRDTTGAVHSGFDSHRNHEREPARAGVSPAKCPALKDRGPCVGTVLVTDAAGLKPVSRDPLNVNERRSSCRSAASIAGSVGRRARAGRRRPWLETATAVRTSRTSPPACSRRSCATTPARARRTTPAQARTTRARRAGRPSRTNANST